VGRSDIVASGRSNAGVLGSDPAAADRSEYPSCPGRTVTRFDIEAEPFRLVEVLDKLVSQFLVGQVLDVTIDLLDQRGIPLDPLPAHRACLRWRG
jgi:hypothetical protein